MKLIVLWPDPEGLSTYAKVAQSEVRPLLSPGALNVITGVRVPIKAGELIGAFVPDGQPGDLGSCLTYTGQSLDHFVPQTMRASGAGSGYPSRWRSGESQQFLVVRSNSE